MTVVVGGGGRCPCRETCPQADRDALEPTEIHYGGVPRVRLQFVQSIIYCPAIYQRLFLQPHDALLPWRRDFLRLPRA